MASSHRALQETVDRFDLIYNTERPHQGLPWRITPQQSWDATDLAEPPRPQPIPVLPGPAVGDGPEAPNRSVTAGLEAETLLETSTPGNLCGTISHPATTGSQKIRVYSNGVVKFGRTLYSLTKPMGGRTVIADLDPEGTMFASTEGEIIAEFAWPPEGTSYVGIGKARTVFRS